MKIVTNWRPASGTTLNKLDDHTLHIKGDFGSFTANGASYTLNDLYIVRPSAHLYNGGGLPMELNAKARGPSGSLTIVIFVEVENMPEYDTFMYTASLGTEETKEQGVGLPRKNYDVIDMNLAFPTPPPGETVLHYPGNSIYDSCEPTYYVISKTTIIINPEQLNELMDRQSNYPVNPNKIIVFDDKKPPEDPKPVPPKNDTRPPNPDPYDIRDPYIFDIVIYINIYPVYPYPRYKDPPQIPEKYPYPDFPYPDTWSWTGQPNYPNDPWYP